MKELKISVISININGLYSSMKTRFLTCLITQETHTDSSLEGIKLKAQMKSLSCNERQ